MALMPAMLVLAAAWLLGAAGGVAEAPGYTAPPVCPDQRAFSIAVSERLGGARSSTAALGSPGLRSLRVTITASAAGFSGELAREGGPVRRLEGRSCDDLVRALALVTAMTLDAEPPPPILEQLPRAKAAPPAKPPKKAAPPPDATIAIGADGAVAFGMVPGNGFGLPVFVEIRFKNGIRARGVYQRVSGDALGLSAGAASFTYNVGRLELCPISMPVGPVEVTPCALGEAGTVHASPSLVSSALPTDQLWGAAGALLRLRYMVSTPLFIEGNASFFVPFNRSRYIFSPGVEVFTTPSIGAAFGLGAGIVFW